MVIIKNNISILMLIESMEQEETAISLTSLGQYPLDHTLLIAMQVWHWHQRPLISVLGTIEVTHFKRLSHSYHLKEVQLLLNLLTLLHKNSEESLLKFSKAAVPVAS